MEPTIGRIVLYTLKLDDLERFARDTPGAKFVPGDTVMWHGNPLKVGDEYPMVVVRPWFSPGSYVKGSSVLNGAVLLDGPATFWALSVAEAGGSMGDGPGTWRWPPRA